jgi:dTDP-glucose 4,6-dehydratase
MSVGASPSPFSQSRTRIMIFVTGAAGFIGANFVIDWFKQSDEPVLVIDKLTYAGNRESLSSLDRTAGFSFVRADICDRPAIQALIDQHRPRAVLHFAAESHVDRSIHGPGEFVRTNINGTFELLEAVRAYWSRPGADGARRLPLPSCVDR